MPSLVPLHLHIISLDLTSPQGCLKHKKHWNSFATPFLVRARDVEVGWGFGVQGSGFGVCSGFARGLLGV